MKADVSFIKVHVLGHLLMNITQDLPFHNIYNPFTNERITIYLD